MHVAYLVNQYPRISLSFIRREISGVENSGVQVSRYSIRALDTSKTAKRELDTKLLDTADQAEALKTQTVLNVGWLGLLGHWIGVAMQRPYLWITCLGSLFHLSSTSDRHFIYHLAYMAEACVLLHWFSRDRIDHVHAHFGTNSTSVAMLCHRLGGPPYSFTVHGPEEFDKPIALSLSTKIEQAKFVIAVSNFGKSQLCRWCSHQHWQKINVVHCGLDQNFLQCESLPPIPKSPTFVCVARLSEQKGHLLLLEAVKQLADNGHRFKLVLVGDGPLRPTLEKLITTWEIEDFVEFAGWASGSTVRERILEARAFVLPSFAEGLPVVIMEALSLGRPVISTYIAGIPELLEDNVCGWLIPSGSVKALTEAMTTAMYAPISVLESMGAVGAARVAQQHNATTEAEKLVRLFYDEINPLEEIVSIKKQTTQIRKLTLEASRIHDV